MGRSRGGLTTKIHALVDAEGRPVALELSAGQAHDCTMAETLLEPLDEGATLLADKAYDTNAIWPAAGFEDTEIGCFWNWRAEMTRRQFSREFKREAVHLVAVRGVSVAQAARDLDVHVTVLRRWVKQYGADPAGAFPGNGQMTPADDEVRRLRREVATLKAERDILKKAAAYFAKDQA